MDPGPLSYLSIGSLGTGFGEESLERGLALGSISSAPTRAASTAAPRPSPAAHRPGPTPPTGATSASFSGRHVAAGVPLLVGSCALSGRDWGVDYFADMARSIAEEFNLSFSMTRIYSEIQPELVIERLAAGPGAPHRPRTRPMTPRSPAEAAGSSP